MYKWILVAVAVLILYKLITNHKKKLKKQEDKETKINTGQPETGVLVKDPICGTYVSNKSDIRVKDHDAVHCFCSYTCRDKYIKQRQAVPDGPEQKENDKN